MMQFLNFEIKPCEEDDAEFFHKKIDEISDSIVPPAEGTEDEYVFLKITDDEDLTYRVGRAGDHRCPVRRSGVHRQK